MAFGFVCTRMGATEEMLTVARLRRCKWMPPKHIIIRCLPGQSLFYSNRAHTHHHSPRRIITLSVTAFVNGMKTRGGGRGGIKPRGYRFFCGFPRHSSGVPPVPINHRDLLCFSGMTPGSPLSRAREGTIVLSAVFFSDVTRRAPSRPESNRSPGMRTRREYQIRNDRPLVTRL